MKANKNQDVLQEDKEQQNLEKFSLKEKIKDITSNILSKLPTKKS